MTETAALSGDNPALLMRKFHNYIFTGTESRQSVIRHIQPMANFKCNGIIDFLRETCPKLTEDDLTFCSLLCLGFAPNSIQMLFGQSHPTSFYNRRARLRRRLGITEGDRALEIVLSEMSEMLSERKTTERGRESSTGGFLTSTRN